MYRLQKMTKIVVGIAVIGLLFSFENIKRVSSTEWKGVASYYHQKFNGRETANGEIFSNEKFTAANNFLRLGTRVRITNPENGESIVVKINDRMNKKNHRLIDLSGAAAKKLGLIKQGIGQVVMEVIDFEDQVDDINSLLIQR